MSQKGQSTKNFKAMLNAIGTIAFFVGIYFIAKGDDASFVLVSPEEDFYLGLGLIAVGIGDIIIAKFIIKDQNG